MILFHPSDIALARFADERREGPRSERVAGHLEKCARCREKIVDMKSLGAAARRAPVPDVAAYSWQGISDRRKSGTRVLLPAREIEAARARVRWMRASLIAGAAAAVVIAIALTGRLGASPTGQLSFEPRRPKAGAEVTLKYRPVASLADQTRLVVRARFLSEDDLTGITWALWNYFGREPAGAPVTSLVRGADGIFTGTVRLPDSLAYALFAIEDPSGDQVDADAGRLWDLVVAGAHDRPGFVGLTARAARSTPATRGRAVAAADSLVLFYPDSAQSWAVQITEQGSSRIPNWLNVFDSREKRFKDFDERLASRPVVSANEMGAMVSLAEAIEEPAAAERWRKRLIGEHPSDPVAVVAMATRIDRLPAESANAYLSAAESAWPRARGAAPVVAEEASRIAVRSGDAAAIRRWQLRVYDVSPWGYLYLAAGDLLDSLSRATAAAALRRNLTTLSIEPSPTRSLLSTVARDRSYRRGLRAHTLGSLASVLIADGAPAAARDTIDVAISLAAGYCGFEYLHDRRATADRALGDSGAAAADAVAAARKTTCSWKWARP